MGKEQKQLRSKEGWEERWNGSKNIGNVRILISKTPRLSDKMFLLTLQHPHIAQKMRNEK